MEHPAIIKNFIGQYIVQNKTPFKWQVNIKVGSSIVYTCTVKPINTTEIPADLYRSYTPDNIEYIKISTFD